MGLLWHLALRRYPSAMTELSRRFGRDGYYTRAAVNRRPA